MSRSSESFRGQETDLASALRFSTFQLLGLNLEGDGSLNISANVDEGSVQVGNQDALPFPLESPIMGLRVGKVGVSMTADGYQPLFQETYVFNGLQNDLNLTLEPLPQAWYERWYLWAGVGAVIVGSVTAAILLAEPPPSGELIVNVQSTP